MLYRSIAGTMLSFALLANETVAPKPKKEDAPVRKEFDKRINDYLKLRNSAKEGIPALKPKATPEEIQASKVALAQAIRSARSDARQGMVFTPEIQKHVLEILRSEMRGKQGAPAKKAAKQGNPTEEVPSKPVAVKVNAPYPDNVPLSTVPPTLLLRLPDLPKELDYRFVGRHLILRDVGADVIVDYIPNAMP
jgi:hypothetical protein